MPGGVKDETIVWIVRPRLPMTNLNSIFTPPGCGGGFIVVYAVDSQSASGKAQSPKRVMLVVLPFDTLCAEFRFHARRYDEVLPLLARSLEIDPHFWVAHILSAKMYQFLGVMTKH